MKLPSFVIDNLLNTKIKKNYFIEYNDQRDWGGARIPHISDYDANLQGNIL